MMQKQEGWGRHVLPAKEHGEDRGRIDEVLGSHTLFPVLVIPLALCWIAQHLHIMYAAL